MPSWEKVIQELKAIVSSVPENDLGIALDVLRHHYLSELSKKTGRNTIVYYSGFLTGLSDNLGINPTDMTGFVNALDGLDCSRGLDLILHTPGGDPDAADSIVHYLHSMFGNDIRVIVPHMAMSAGTLISCSARSILMAKHSSLGPVDPQFSGSFHIAAYDVVQEFEDAKADLDQNPNAISYWSLVLGKYPPGMLYTARDAVERSNALVTPFLRQYMFADEEKGKELDKKIRRIREKLNSNNNSHGCPFHYDFCKSLGLKVEELEADPEVYDLVMGVHNAFSISSELRAITKIIQNQNGACYLTRQNG